MILPGFIDGSGKLNLTIETFKTLQSEGRKVLILSSFVKHLGLIADEFRKRQWDYALLADSSTNRPEGVVHFSRGPRIQAFLISLKAGEVDLNLTQADYMSIIDPWWNPAAEAQATTRAYCTGQGKQVIVCCFIIQGSIEEKIIQLQEGERKLVEILITETDQLPTLTNQEWAGFL